MWLHIEYATSTARCFRGEDETKRLLHALDCGEGAVLPLAQLTKRQLQTSHEKEGAYQCQTNLRCAICSTGGSAFGMRANKCKRVPPGKVKVIGEKRVGDYDDFANLHLENKGDV
jgi:hypothetical protein